MKRRIRLDAPLVYKLLLAISDVFSLVVAFYLSFTIRNAFFAWRGGVYQPNILHEVFLVCMTVSILVYFRHSYLYRRPAYRPSIEHLEILTKTWMAFASFFIFLAFFLKVQLFIEHRITMLILIVLGWCLLYGGRFVLVPTLSRRLTLGDRYPNGVLCVSLPEEAERVRELVSHDQSVRSRMLGYLCDTPPAAPGDGPTWLGTVAELPRIVKTGNVCEVFFRMPVLDWDALNAQCRTLMSDGIRVRIAVEHFGALSQHVSDLPERESGYVFINESPLRTLESYLKRAFDLVGSLLGLVLLSPFFALIAILIKAESAGPVFFRQVRVGLGGAQFNVFKFRTMRQNTESHHKEIVRRFVNGDTDFMKKETGRSDFFKVTHDEMVTRVGRFLRRSGLDELPQLINVLMGQMALVGPRPLPVYEVELFKDWQHMRHEVRPGITGFWQVFGRSRVSHLDTILMDVFYMMNWSLSLDFRILVRTVFVMMTGKGGL